MLRRPVAWLVIASPVVAGVALRLAYFTSDTLNFDEYGCMLGVRGGFSEYVFGSPFTLPIAVHYWVTTRLLGSQLWEYRLASLLASVLLLALAAGAIRVVRPKASLVVTFGLVFWLAVNSYSLFTASYSNVSYSVSLLASAVVFFLLTFLVRTSLKRWTVIWMSACFIPLAFFSLFTIVVPVTAGIALLLAYRILVSRGRRLASVVGTWVLDATPLLLFIVLQGVVYLLNPFTNYGAAKRPDMAEWFLGQSELSGSVSGAIRFVVSRTYMTARSSSDALDSSSVSKVVLIVGGIFVCVAISQALRRPRDSQVLFAAAYIVVLGVACAIGAIVGLYPYGSVRYEYFLIVPAGFLVAQGLASVVTSANGKVKLVRAHPRRVNAAALAGATLVVALALFVAADRTDEFLRANRLDERWFATTAARVAPRHSVVVLCDGAANPVVTVRLLTGKRLAPNSIGWGSSWGRPEVPAATQAMLRQSALGSKPAAVLLVLWGEAGNLAQFPWVAEYLGRGFVLQWSSQGPYLWAGLYVPVHRPSAAGA